VFELLQLTDLSVASSGLTVATSVEELPSSKEILSLSMTTLSTGTETVTVHVACLSPALAVMVADPPATAVTLPFESTVTIFVLELPHVTVLSVASSGFTVAVRVSDWPLSSTSSDMFSETELTATKPLLTVTIQVADFPPAETVIVEDPSEMAVISPLFEIVATDGLEEAQIMVLSVAFDGKTVAVN
jgi:hypothetical protein